MVCPAEKKTAGRNYERPGIADRAHAGGRCRFAAGEGRRESDCLVENDGSFALRTRPSRSRSPAGAIADCEFSATARCSRRAICSTSRTCIRVDGWAIPRRPKGRDDRASRHRRSPRYVRRRRYQLRMSDTGLVAELMTKFSCRAARAIRDSTMQWPVLQRGLQRDRDSSHRRWFAAAAASCTVCKRRFNDLREGRRARASRSNKRAARSRRLTAKRFCFARSHACRRIAAGSPTPTSDG